MALTTMRRVEAEEASLARSGRSPSLHGPIHGAFRSSHWLEIKSKAARDARVTERLDPPSSVLCSSLSLNHLHPQPRLLSGLRVALCFAGRGGGSTVDLPATEIKKLRRRLATANSAGSPFRQGWHPGQDKII